MKGNILAGGSGTHGSLMDAAAFLQTIENRQRIRTVCLEEIASRNGWPSAEFVLAEVRKLEKTGCGKYLTQVIQETNRDKA